MSRNAKLIDALFTVSRGDLENAVFPQPRVGPLLDSFSFSSLRRMSRFWQEDENLNLQVLQQAACDLIAGGYGLKQPWIFLIDNNISSCTCWFGLPRSSWRPQDVESTLGGVFPDARFGKEPGPDARRIGKLSHAKSLTGIPTGRATTNDDQIERLCRGLSGSNWAYLVHATPVPQTETLKSINDLSQNLCDIHETYLLKETAVDQSNRHAQNLVELLEKKIERLVVGRAVGMWTVQTLLLAERPETADRGSGLLHSAFSGHDSLPVPLRSHNCGAMSGGLPSLEPLNTNEVAVLARPPRESFPGYEVVDNHRFGVSPPPASARESIVNIGEIIDRGTGTNNSFSLPLKDLVKHGVIAGVTGSGKTNTCFSLLDQVWDGGKGVPFLVIESAKAEYRSLLDNPRFQGLNVFTVGDETCSPLRLNPFEVPPGVLVQTHIDYLKSLFSAAFVLYPPMPYILEICLQRIYENKGWDLTRNTNPRGEGDPRAFPTLTSLANLIPRVVREVGYHDKISQDVQAGLLARINNLRIGGGKGPMLDTLSSLPAGLLFNKPCLLELKSLVNDDEKAFVIGLVLIRLYEYCETQQGDTSGNLRHVTLIEEAHRLLRNTHQEQGSEISANPRGNAVEVFSNILSEIRAFGEGLFLAEQVPTKLTPDALKNTNLKIVHRLVSHDDRETVGGAMNLLPEKTLPLSTLTVGQCLTYADGMTQPALVQIGLTSEKKSPRPLANHKLKSYMDGFWQRNPQLKLRYPGCANCIEAGPTSCMPGIAPRHDETLVGTRFRQLFNALRLNKPLVTDSFLAFDLVCHQTRHQAGNRTGSYCLFVKHLEAEMERRGETYFWPFAEIEKAIADSCTVTWELSRNLGNIDTKKLETGIAPNLRSFSNRMDRLHKSGRLPFPGCRHCDAPCQYRFDMAQDTYDMDGARFREIFSSPNFRDSDWDVLARFCVEVAHNAFSPKDLRSLRGGGLCFAVQQFGMMGMRAEEQEAMVQKVAPEISKIQ